MVMQDTQPLPDFGGEADAARSPGRLAKLAVPIVAAGLATLLAASTLLPNRGDSNNSVPSEAPAPTEAPAPPDTTITSPEDPITTETTVREAPPTTQETFQDVSEQLKERLRQSSFKLVRETKDPDNPEAPPRRESVCNTNALSVTNSKGEKVVVFGTAAHCVDVGTSESSYPIQTRLMGSQGEVAATDISSEINDTFYIFNNGDDVTTANPVAEISVIAESIGTEYNELVLMKPTVETDELRNRALDLKAGQPKKGEQIFFVGQPNWATQPQETTMTYVGESVQYYPQFHFMNAVANNVSPGQTNQKAFSYGASGGFGITASGIPVGPQHSYLEPGSHGVDNNGMSTPEQESEWLQEVTDETGKDVSNEIVIQFSGASPGSPVFKAELAVIEAAG